MKDYIVILNDGHICPNNAIRLAKLLSNGFHKRICLLCYGKNSATDEHIRMQHHKWITTFQLDGFSEIRSNEQDQLHHILSELEAAFLLIEPSANSAYKKLQPLLSLCKPLRIPYIFIKSDLQTISLERALVPVGFLAEEKEKGIFASKLARFCNTSITLLQAKDFGSRAQNNTLGIKTLFDKLDLNCKIEMARKDSFKVQNEAAMRALDGDADILLITSSREYGLDDIIFGPPERKIIQKAQIPVMVINPRRDIYVLCE